MTALAYSYLRFSSPQQSTGDSIRRQTEAREKWLTERPGVTLDTSLRMTDAGRSGFRRKDWDTYALAQFVAHIKSGRVEPGSYLLVENLDRLSRESAGEATELFLSIVNKGIVIVQLSPAILEFKRPVDTMQLMFAIVELSRGHSESSLKSERVGKAWARKQREAGEKIVTKRLPGWVKLSGSKLVLDEPGAALVRRIYQMAIDGAGGMTIAKQFNKEGVPVMGRKIMKGRNVLWSNVNVNFILTSRAVLGEYIPYRTDRNKPSGDPVLNYYPPVVEEKTYYAAQAALSRRKDVGKGRRGKHVNFFAGLLHDARDGGTITYRHQKPFAVLVPTNAIQGVAKSKYTTFPVIPFEDAIVSCLSEVKVSDIVGGNGVTTEIASLSGRRIELEAIIGAWEAKMGDIRIVDTVAANLAKFKGELDKVNKELAITQRKAASPISEALGSIKTLADLLKKDGSDEVRLKVRAAIRQCVERIDCLFVGDTVTRRGEVRIKFVSGKWRDYIIVNRRSGSQSRWGVTSVSSDEFIIDGKAMKDTGEWGEREVQWAEQHLQNMTKDVIDSLLEEQNNTY